MLIFRPNGSNKIDGLFGGIVDDIDEPSSGVVVSGSTRNDGDGGEVMFDNSGVQHCDDIMYTCQI